MNSGIVLIDKPSGVTSFDCIRLLKKKWDRSDLGHGGTLDKFASGLLPVLAGEGLKLARFFLESYPSLPTYWKTYEGTIELGRSTETGDPEGATVATLPVGELVRAKIQELMGEFVSREYEQLPPKYSAKKIEGERASDLARQGKEVVLKPVKVTIRRFECTSIDGDKISFVTECSKGTYVRVLAEDLSQKLGTVGHLISLRRTHVGNFELSDAISIDSIPTGDDSMLQLAQATSFLAPFPLIGAELEHLKVGKIDGLTTRLANSGFAPTIYCATSVRGNDVIPVALLELTSENRAHFLRKFI